MNWDTLSAQVLDIVGSDELKAFMLGVLFAVGVRLIRMGIAWLKKIEPGESA